MKQGVEDIISFPHCRRQYADETMKDRKKKPSCQSPWILSSHKAPVSNVHITHPTLQKKKKKKKSPRTLQPKCTAVLRNAKPPASFTTINQSVDLGRGRQDNRFERRHFLVNRIQVTLSARNESRYI